MDPETKPGGKDHYYEFKNLEQMLNLITGGEQYNVMTSQIPYGVYREGNFLTAYLVGDPTKIEVILYLQKLSPLARCAAISCLKTAESRKEEIEFKGRLYNNTRRFSGLDREAIILEVHNFSWGNISEPGHGLYFKLKDGD